MIKIKDLLWVLSVIFYIYFVCSVYGYYAFEGVLTVSGVLGQYLVANLLEYYGYIPFLVLIGYPWGLYFYVKGVHFKGVTVASYYVYVFVIVVFLYFLFSVQWTLSEGLGFNFSPGMVSALVGGINSHYLGGWELLVEVVVIALLFLFGLFRRRIYSWFSGMRFSYKGSSQGSKGDSHKGKVKKRVKVDKGIEHVQGVLSVKSKLPELSLLDGPEGKMQPLSIADKKSLIKKVESSLSSFKIDASIVDVMQGPVITQLHIDLASGVKSSSIINVATDIARTMKVQSARVGGVVSGTSYVGLEIPNAKRRTVKIKEILNSEEFMGAKSSLPIALGCDLVGEPCVIDLAKTPHLLVAGTTGSGKSVGVNAMIVSLLYKLGPEHLRFIMIDPKMLELSVYQGIPHMLSDVITDMSKAAEALSWCVKEMDDRYSLMSKQGVRSIDGYNELILKNIEKSTPLLGDDGVALKTLPFVVVVIDEFADLIMTAGKKVEEYVARLAQKSRACGMHMVIATQRPSVNVLTGLIKANIPSRISFQVSSKIDSRTILDQSGGEQLLGMGDMLISMGGSNILKRAHGPFVTDGEVASVVEYWKGVGSPAYVELSSSKKMDGEVTEMDEMDREKYHAAIEMMEHGKEYSISKIQRELRIGYNKASRVVELLILNGVLVEDADKKKKANIPSKVQA